MVQDEDQVVGGLLLMSKVLCVEEGEMAGGKGDRAGFVQRER